MECAIFFFVWQTFWQMITQICLLVTFIWSGDGVELINSVERVPPSEANICSFSADQEISHLYGTPKAHWSVAIVRILSQLNPIHAL